MDQDVVAGLGGADGQDPANASAGPGDERPAAFVLGPRQSKRPNSNRLIASMATRKIRMAATASRPMLENLSRLSGPSSSGRRGGPQEKGRRFAPKPFRP